jgi:TPR repeat protein
MRHRNDFGGDLSRPHSPCGLVAIYRPGARDTGSQHSSPPRHWPQAPALRPAKDTVNPCIPAEFAPSKHSERPSPAARTTAQEAASTADAASLTPEDLDRLHRLALCYLDGGMGHRDCSTALTLLHLAADHDHADALHTLGTLHRQGQCVRRNQERAAEYFTRSAVRGHAVAQFNLGLCYEHGNGVTRDPVEAARWFRMAAERGDEAARRALERVGATSAEKPSLRTLRLL